MAEPKTEIDRRLDRQESAISMMAYKLAEKHLGFSEEDVDEIEKILRGEESGETKDAGT